MAIGSGDPRSTVPNRTRESYSPPPRPRKISCSKTTNPMIKDSQPPQLPREVIVQIFSKLPVKSLLKFRCVSKSCRSLISDPYFIKKHLHMSSTDANYHNHRLVVNYNDPAFNFTSASLYSLFNESYADVTNLKHPFGENSNSNDYCIVGSCNGLLCIAKEYLIYLWNPSTREIRLLPLAYFTLPKQSAVYGFGYDSSHDDYKLMVTFYHGDSHNVGEAYLYTLTTNSWRKIEKSPVELPRKPGISVGGALIWSTVDFGDLPGRLHAYWKIVAFDLANEKYQEVPQPMREDGAYDYSLGVLGGCLCLVANYRGTHADMWVMKDYGVKESWTKLITIPCFLNLSYFELLRCSSPIWFLNKGELVVNLNQNFGVHAIKDNTWRSPGIYYFHSSMQSSVYIESLVSPFLTTRMNSSTNNERKRKAQMHPLSDI